GMQGKTGTITQDDSVRFLEDERVYKAKFQGNAFPMDEYAFVLLDISELKTELPILTKAVTA
ncbi:phage major capsid protein, partial [bacterium]|nr:phage major capsid protein [bacterium]